MSNIKKYMEGGKKTKKNLSTMEKNKNGNKEFIDSLLNKSNKTKISSLKFDNLGKIEKKHGRLQTKNIISSNKNINKPIISKPIISKPIIKNKNHIISNFHKAISSTNSDEIILKMLDLKDSEIIKFYKNLEGLIGKDMSYKIKNEMANQLMPNNQVMQNNGRNIRFNISLCHLCQYNKNDCVILLCGHLICKKCARNITRCKYPCPKCKKPIKFIQYIVE
jgi:hypothetical protein